MEGGSSSGITCRPGFRRRGDRSAHGEAHAFLAGVASRAAMSAQDVAAAFLRHARESLGAEDAAIYLTAGSALRRAVAFGVPERWPEILPREGSAHPLCGAAVEWIEGARALVARFP